MLDQANQHLLDSLQNERLLVNLRIDSIKKIIDENSAILDTCIADNLNMVDSLENHLDCLETQINGIYANSEPLAHLGNTFYYYMSLFYKVIIDLLQKLGLEGIQNMDDWNLFVTVCVYCVSIYVLIVGLFYIFIRKRKQLKNVKKRKIEELSSSKRIVNRILWAIFFIPKHILLLPILIVDLASKIIEYFRNPIKFDRDILSADGKQLIKLSVKIAVLLPLTIVVVLSLGSIIGQYIQKGAYSSALGIYDTESSNRTNILWATLSQYMDPGNISNSDGVGSLVALLMATCGIVCLSGLLVSSLVNWLSLRRDRWQKGLITYDEVKDFKNYVVIIGINEQTVSLVRKSFKKAPNSYVLIQTRKDVEKARMDLELKMDDDYENRIVFYSGERTSSEDIGKLKLEKAVELYILGEDMQNNNEKDHDAFNMSCLEHVSSYMSKDFVKAYREKHIQECDRRLKCHVDFEYQSTYTIFKSTHIYRDIDAKDIEFLPFNVQEIWAKKVLVQNHALIQQDKNDSIKVQRYLPLDAYWKNEKGKRSLFYIDADCNKTVHLFIFGMNQMGTALATQAALLIHLPNFHRNSDDNTRLRTTITFVDDNAVKEAEFFMGRFSVMFELCRYKIVNLNDEDIRKPYTDPMLSPENRFSHLGSNFMDIQWEFIQGNVANSQIKKYIGNCCKSNKETCTIAVCFNDPQQSIATAMYLSEDILKEALQILVYQQNSFDMIEKVAHGEKQWKRYEKLRPFGLIENSYEGSIFDNLLAKLIYFYFKSSADVKEQLLADSIVVNKSLINEVNRLWDELGIVDKLSNIDLADSFEMKLRSSGTTKYKSIDEQIKALMLNEDNLRLFSFAEHNRWLTERLTMGYRPLNKKEWQIYFDIPERQNTKKELFKSKSRAHVDICSNEDLDNKVEIKNKHNNDVSFLRSLPFLFELKEKILLYAREKDSILDLFVKDMVYVEGGVMNVDADKDSERASKTISCDSFNMSKYPLAQELWELIYGKENNPSGHLGNKYPVENVSLIDIWDFLLILESKTGLRFSIPSVDEWEFAARGGNYSQKYKFSGSNDVSEVAWFHTESSHGVGTKLKPNELGLFDMSGNVWEWTKSHSDVSSFYFCGGSWKFTEHWCNLYECYGSWTPEFKSKDLGLRLVIPVKYRINHISNNDSSGDGCIEKLLLNHFVHIPTGEFKMGLPENFQFPYIRKELDVSAEQPQHSVIISDFFMGKTPVTQRIWKAVMDCNPSLHKGDDFPVENVSFPIVQDFLSKLNNNKRLRSCLGIRKELEFRLPTEAEWEYAARGGNTDEDVLFAGSSDAYEVAWHSGLTKTTQPVAKKKPNEYGLYDMCGNVWEWCNDWYLRNYYHKCQAKGVVADPGGPEGPRSARVFRGGSFMYNPEECRVTKPGYWIEEHTSPDLGFRIVIGRKVKFDKIDSTERIINNSQI